MDQSGFAAIVSLNFKVFSTRNSDKHNVNILRILRRKFIPRRLLLNDSARDNFQLFFWKKY